MRIKNVLFPLLLWGVLVGTAVAEVATPALSEEPEPVTREILAAAGYDVESLNLQWDKLDRFYTQHQAYIWHDRQGLTRNARTLMAWIARVDAEGLTPADYHLNRLNGLATESSAQASLKLAEILLTDAFFRLAGDLTSGRFEAMAYDPLWQISGDAFDPVELLIQALNKGDVSQQLGQLLPGYEAYLRLRVALAGYREIEARGGWPQFNVVHTLRPGDEDPAVAGLRRRLEIEDVLAVEPVDNPDFFDAGLQAAVREFQRRHGLEADGAVGPKTREALNIPVEQKIAQIRLNLERWRWLPRDLGDRYLIANTAGYELSLMVEGQKLFQTRTINGKTQRQTPSFASRITHFVVNPQWTVPRTIAVEDLLPKQQQDGSFLESRAIKVMERVGGEWWEVNPHTLDWSQYHEDNFPFTLRQAAGGQNSLGRVKFYMPNEHDIFLHDTPAVGLFKHPIRAFSSGCVRVQGAQQLAHQLLRVGSQSPLDELVRPLKSGETLTTVLSQPMPVYLVYFTVWVDDSGEVQFRPDIFERDKDLLLALGEPAIGGFSEQKTASLQY
jgi:murein L,D-transpeptidase YcbB/YkuD